MSSAEITSYESASPLLIRPTSSNPVSEEFGTPPVQDHSPGALQKSPLAPPPPEAPPPKRKSLLPVCGAGVIDWGVSRPNTADPAFIQFLSFSDNRSAVEPWRLPLGLPPSQRRMKTATPVNNMPRIIGSQVCRRQPGLLVTKDRMATIAPTPITKR